MKVIIITLDGRIDNVYVGESTNTVTDAAKHRMGCDGNRHLADDMIQTIFNHGYYEYNGNDGKVTLQLADAVKF